MHYVWCLIVQKRLKDFLTPQCYFNHSFYTQYSFFLHLEFEQGSSSCLLLTTLFLTRGEIYALRVCKRVVPSVSVGVAEPITPLFLLFVLFSGVICLAI